MVKYLLLFLITVNSLFVYSASKDEKYYVISKKLNVREAPNEKAKIIGKKIESQLVYIKEVQGAWARVELYDDKILADGTRSSSWVLLKYLSTTQPEAPKTKYETNAISEQIVRSTSDRGRYFLVYLEKSGSNFIVVTSRIGVDSQGYTKMEINCLEQKYRELAYTEGHIEQFEFKQDRPSKWVALVVGSSKFDTVQYVCGTRGQLR